jgi:uncharacterized protein YndB with AHSA1/START domain
MPEPIVKETRIDASPETVFAFFTERDLLTRWLAVEATLDARPGGACHQTHTGQDGQTYSMLGEFLVVEPPTRVVFTWGFEEPSVGVAPGASTVEVTLERDGDGTLLRLEHRDLPNEERSNHDSGWDEMLRRLAGALAALASSTA